MFGSAQAPALCQVDLPRLAQLEGKNLQDFEDGEFQEFKILVREGFGEVRDTE